MTLPIHVVVSYNFGILKFRYFFQFILFLAGWMSAYGPSPPPDVSDDNVM